MKGGLEATQRALLLREIACLVGEAERNGGKIATGTHAAMLFATYPGANFSVGRIIDEIVLAASAKRLVVEIDRPRPEASYAAS